jgi:hypothetical protein
MYTHAHVYIFIHVNTQQTTVAATLYGGVGGEKNLREALQWFHVAADHSLEPSAEAQYSLARIYEQVCVRVCMYTKHIHDFVLAPDNDTFVCKYTY